MNTQPLILDIGHIQRRIHAVQLDIASYGVTLRLADFATLLMLFVFLVGFYVADPFHIASFIAQRFGANGTVELAVYALLLVMAGLMAVTTGSSAHRMKKNEVTLRWFHDPAATDRTR